MDPTSLTPQTKTWDPTQYFRQEHTSPFALLILNQPINERAYNVLKEHAKLTVCADGGANHFYEMMKARGRENIGQIPNTIIGDLDSIHADIRAHYEKLGVHVLEDADQYSTDFTKCLRYLSSYRAELTGQPREALDVLILGGLGGRVDQAFSQISHLYSMSRTFSSNAEEGGSEGNPLGNLYLISEESITFILHPGENVIRTPGANRPGCGAEGHLLEENVGIIPLSGPARITTSGFQWDVEDWRTEIGGQLSTSNHIRADVVSVKSAVPVLFTLELASRFKRAR
ncbi:thiamine pyrophosphokinase [Aspergillus avenaceus]|uniref:Thiamine pyrophosphokinase n=1 Tax=Aspergillus avenaceus TaxID=36643 RepID=A0A5N6TV36_ASPAV|nr:thiamine pyrophosphokinase [Aspergillus avenaceus]